MIFLYQASIYFMTKTRLEDLFDLKKNGAITEEEFNKLKQGLLDKSDKSLQQPQRTGIGWQEILGVFFGILGGIIYVVRAKQSGKKKLIVFSLAFFLEHDYI